MPFLFAQVVLRRTGARLRGLLGRTSLPEGAALVVELPAVNLVPHTFGVLLFSLGGLVLAARQGSPLSHRALLVSFLAFSILGVCPGLYFRSHYFILALPAVCLLAGAALEWLMEAAAGQRPAAKAGVLALFAIAVSQPLVSICGLLWKSPPEQVSRALYGRNPFPEATVIGRYLRDHTGPDERIAVLGSEPEILFYSQRRSATRHIYMYNLVNLQPFAQTMQEQLIGEVEAARPAYLVYVRTRSSWLTQPGASPRIFQWAEDYLRRDYEEVGQVEAPDPAHTRYLWDAEAAAASTDFFTQLQLFRRRSAR